MSAQEAKEPNITACPTCGGGAVIAEVNCGIFRHAVLRSTGECVNPHAGEAEIERLLAEKAIWGCGQPFRLVGGRAEKCGWM